MLIRLVGGLMHADMAMERDRRHWEEEVKGNLASEQALDIDRDRRIEVRIAQYSILT